ncbi:hypothetical protein K437DRAFT_259893 [Tilletiaria anomala UBC 951]|uniref:histone acetyltransferase n=1 Tax=Tilletiaria anomala (strain ATCC 24038 / CBS 436.72 / UBC 951) TaxID=1037660 RepID=A0A066VEN0_TILAU|nr:uncharacterized protein K437DRAFT_259893 [Tilletiaria anomala UBC 951]KDN37219.1 hypothetical protein K437DRAFT_259893 [Tilletiaria anomala UBC 951]
MTLQEATTVSASVPLGAESAKLPAAAPLASSSARTSSPSAPALLQHLLHSLRTSAPVLHLGQSGRVKLHVLFGAPRPARELYALAHVHPLRPDGKNGWLEANVTEAWCEKVFLSASWEEGDEKVGEGGSRLIYALECFLYTLPNHRSAVLYVSKLDTTGYAPPGIIDPVFKDARPFISAVLAKRQQDSAQGRATPTPVPTTLVKLLTHSFLSYFTSFAHWRLPVSHPSPSFSREQGEFAIDHLSLHILARAQAAYLFPSSPDNTRKHVLSDAALIKWWRSVVSDVVANAQLPAPAEHSDGEPEKSSSDVNVAGTATRVDTFYLIPGYSAVESTDLIPLPPKASAATSVATALQRAKWNYGHPYSRAYATADNPAGYPLPLHHAGVPPAHVPIGSLRSSSTIASLRALSPAASQGLVGVPASAKRQHSIATLIPRFEDDPKGRFIDEIVRDAHEHAGFVSGDVRALLQKLDAAARDADRSKRIATGAEEEAAASRPQRRRKLEAGGEETESAGDDSGISVSDFAAVPAAPPDAAALTSNNRRDINSAASALPPEQRFALTERAALDAISVDEFWERMGYRQECCSGNAVGVFVALFTRGEPPSAATKVNGHRPVHEKNMEEGIAGKERQERSMQTPLTGWRGTLGSVPEALLSELILKMLLLDKNNWGKSADAIELTRKWDQAVSRLLKRKGEGLLQAAAAAATVGESTASDSHAQQQKIGKGIIWDEVQLISVSQDVLEHAKALHEAAKGAQQASGIVGAGGAPVNKINTLSIKRKKKA